MDSEWSILFPAWSVMLFLTAYFVYIALGIYNTPSLSDMNTVTGKSYEAMYLSAI